MRLKLAGGDRSSGSGVLCPGGQELSFNYICALRVRRPQLKRDPLGGPYDLPDGQVVAGTLINSYLPAVHPLKCRTNP